MPGIYRHGKSAYLLIAERKNKKIIYRKYTSKDQYNNMWGMIPPTECGVTFRTEMVGKDNRNLACAADPKISSYISREFCKLMGLPVVPELDAYNTAAAAYNNPEGRLQNLDSVHGNPIKPRKPTLVHPEEREGEFRPDPKTQKVSADPAFLKAELPWEIDPEEKAVPSPAEETPSQEAERLETVPPQETKERDNSGRFVAEGNDDDE